MYGVPKRVQGRVAHDVLLVLLTLLAVAGLSVGAGAEPSVSQASRLPGEPGFMQVGTASWYGQWHHGRTTANGERFDMYAMTAAHKSLPLGTRIRVTNLTNSKAVSHGSTTADRTFMTGCSMSLSGRRSGLVSSNAASHLFG